LPFPLEPDAYREIQMIAEHRPDSFKRWLDTVPSEWWITAIQRGRDYDLMKEESGVFAAHYRQVCDTMRFSHDWFSSKLWAWHGLLAPYRDHPIDVLEIGVFEGRSVVFCLEYAPQSKVVAIDHFIIKKGWTSSQGITLEIDSEDAFDRNVSRYGDRVRKIASPSWSGLSDLIYDRHEFDVIYVDAAHTSPDVLADSLLAWRMLKTGGLFIWDDFMLDVWDMNPNTVTEGICRFLDMYKGQYEWVHAGWQVAVRKIADQPGGSYIGI